MTTRQQRTTSATKRKNQQTEPALPGGREIRLRIERDYRQHKIKGPRPIYTVELDTRRWKVTLQYSALINTSGRNEGDLSARTNKKTQRLQIKKELPIKREITHTFVREGCRQAASLCIITSFSRSLDREAHSITSCSVENLMVRSFTTTEPLQRERISE